MATGPGDAGSRVADERRDHCGPMSVGSGEPEARNSDRPAGEAAGFRSDSENPA